MGSLAILSVYEGDVKLSFDTTNPAEMIRASRIVKDMIRRGYALLIEVDGAYQRAIDFDEKVGEYIIADFDPGYSPQSPRNNNEETGEEQHAQEQDKTEENEEPKPKKRGRPSLRRVKIEGANAVAVARSAGG